MQRSQDRERSNAQKPPRNKGPARPRLLFQVSQPEEAEGGRAGVREDETQTERTLSGCSVNSKEGEQFSDHAKSGE